MIDPTGITSYAYDALNRLTSITNNRGFTTSFTYDALGRRTSMSHGNGVVTSYQYDAASQLTRLAHQLGAATINSFDYTYDRVGNRTSKTNRDGTASYTYDTLNRLVEAINPLPTNPLESFTYDAVGNRTMSNQNGASIFNQANQLTEDANFTYQYDANGNLTRKTAKVGGDFTTYEYDAENKLARVVTPGKTVNYRYDGLGRRVEKEIVDVATTVTRFIYDNQAILLELDGSNNITARYTHGPGIDEPLAMERGGQSFFYHADSLGSITEITNSIGTVVQSYTYSSFGKIESQLDSNFVQPYTFTAREFDPETGLYFYRTRYYDPNTGTFVQRDPIGFASGSLNFYTYANNNPTNLIDPTGLKTFIGCRSVRGTFGALDHCFVRIFPEPGTQLEKLTKRLGRDSLTLSLLTDFTGFLPYDIAGKEINGQRDVNVPAQFEVKPPSFVSACEFDQAVFNEFLQQPTTIPYDNIPFTFNNSNTFVRRVIEGAGGQLPEGLPAKAIGLR